ncbi:MAG: DUF4276 family protein [Alphaproteobacteria bacterium]|nr:DUF4276 family protein [Alphaproteobacteria bacterium]
MTSNNWENVGIICEGKTELDFVKKILNPYFKQHFISFKPILFNSKSSLDGNISIDRLVTFIKRGKYRITTTFVDYYGFKNSKGKTANQIMNEIKDRADKKHLIPYLQIHETEALWFSDTQTLSEAMNADNNQLKKLKEISKKYPNPEDINNSVHTAPSKRLENIFKGYDKITDGNRIAKNIGIEKMIEKCPIFSSWTQDIVDKVDLLRGNKQGL